MKIRFDELELGPVIGSGTVGAVYRARLQGVNERVAVKLLHPAISQDSLVRARFRREMQILERLKHPNIIHYYGSGEHDGQLFYAMELIETGTVKEMLERFGRLSWQEVASITRQVSSALQHSHNQGIIHRDLKPGNLFLNECGQVKLGDFGIARDTRSADLTSEGLTVGTHAYMPPEQITGESHITGKADLYSLGCMMFELLTGRKPYEGTNFAVLFEQHLRATVPSVENFVPNCPRALAEVTAKLMQKDPDERPFNARAVQAEMLRLLEQQPVVAFDPKYDVPAAQAGGAEFHDLGMSSLARKLQAPEQRQVSWTALAWLTAVVLLIIASALLAAWMQAQ